MTRSRTVATTAGIGAVAMVLAAGTATAVLRAPVTDPAAEGTTHRASTPPPTAGSSTPASQSTRSLPTPSDTPAPVPPQTLEGPTLSPKPEPEPVAEPGEHGKQVRAVQARLSQIAWYTPPMSGEFDPTTTKAVRGFQAKRGFEVTGSVDPRTWRRLLAMTRKPTEDEMFNRAGPAILSPGDSGSRVRETQSRLRQIGWFFGDVTDYYGDQTAESVRGFQAKRHVPVTGKVDQRTLDLLHGMTREPTEDELANRPDEPEVEQVSSTLDPRCRSGHVLCIDKTSHSLRWVVDGSVEMSMDVRFGVEYSPTREGLFHVGWKDIDHVSHLYGSAMPYSMFFSGGQAVHYSSDFAARGYVGGSHGCVNVRDRDALASLYDQVDLGDKVVVYRS